MGPWVPIARGFIHATCGEVSAARSPLDAAVTRLPQLPHDSEWLPALTQAAETVQLVGGHPVARWLHDALSPHAGLFVVEGIGALLRGSVERHLGGLAALLGERAAAVRHFERALEANRRRGPGCSSRGRCTTPRRPSGTPTGSPRRGRSTPRWA